MATAPATAPTTTPMATSPATAPTTTLLTGNAAAAWGARLSKVDVVPNFPITPQTEIIETISNWIANGELDTEFLKMESEHSVMSAAVSASATGSRVFTASSSQGLLLMHEMLYIASGLRLPIVMVNVSRGLSAPVTLWSDHNDILAQRDSGWVHYYCQNNQEVLDTVIQTYKVAENSQVQLPVVINMDGFILSFTREPLSIPSQQLATKFVGKRKPSHYLNPKKPESFGAAVLAEYMYFKNQQYLAAKNVFKVDKIVSAEWKKLTGRQYKPIEAYRTSDAKKILVTTNSMSTVAKAAVDDLRKKGQKVGLARIRMYRPFPEKQLTSTLSNSSKIGVVDADMSTGSGGIIANDVKAALYSTGSRPPVHEFIAGLGGKPLTKAHFIKMFKKMDAKPSETWIY